MWIGDLYQNPNEQGLVEISHFEQALRPLPSVVKGVQAYRTQATALCC